jgi:hypothetical protein
VGGIEYQVHYSSSSNLLFCGNYGVIYEVITRKFSHSIIYTHLHAVCHDQSEIWRLYCTVEFVSVIEKTPSL